MNLSFVIGILFVTSNYTRSIGICSLLCPLLWREGNKSSILSFYSCLKGNASNPVVFLWSKSSTDRLKNNEPEWRHGKLATDGLETGGPEF